MALAAALALAGCAELPFSRVADPASTPATAAPIRPAQRPSARAPVDPLSADLAAHYARIEAERRARGLMRTDDGTRDIPISAGRLGRIWTEVALRDEYLGSNRGQRGGASVLRRFQAPVVYRMEFGPSVPVSVQAADRAQVAALVARLSAAARHPMRLAPEGAQAGNFHVLVLSEAERRAIGPRLRQLVPGIDDATVRLVTDMPRETFCLALAFARGGGATYTEAVAIIRAEHPDLTRLSCYHEELTQGLGLAADSPAARPSIFNDDQEFALLTQLDMLMLQLHYDPRLRPGMGEREAAPIAFSIASELAAGES
jgi:hypothetical protein